MSQYRTKLHKGDLRVLRGPSDPGPDARKQDRLVATTRHRRFIQAMAEGILTEMDKDVAATVVESLNGELVSVQRLTRVQERHMKQRLTELEADLAELEAAIAETGSPAVRKPLESECRKKRKDAVLLKGELDANTRAERQPEPRQEVEVADLLKGLAGVLEKPNTSDALTKILHDLRLVRIGTLTLTFQTSVLIPGSSGGPLISLGPVTFKVENTARQPAGDRTDAMAKLCLETAWPVSTVAAGIPLVCSAFAGHRVASALSRRLKALVGSKSASVLGGCQVPEVLAVVSRHLELGKPEVDVAPALKKRIIKTYIKDNPPGPKAWLQENPDSQVVELIRTIHQTGRVSVDETSGTHSRWERRGYLQRNGSNYVQQKCKCGSADLALIPTPEPDGLVCLSCRRDRSGLEIPTSWNTAIADGSYWEGVGYDLSVPALPGLPVRQIVTQPLTLR